MILVKYRDIDTTSITQNVLKRCLVHDSRKQCTDQRTQRVTNCTLYAVLYSILFILPIFEKKSSIFLSSVAGQLSYRETIKSSYTVNATYVRNYVTLLNYCHKGHKCN